LATVLLICMVLSESDNTLKFLSAGRNSTKDVLRLVATSLKLEET
jgi:hypothetical protein